MNTVDRRIPTSYPPEIQALVDAHISGMPIAIISSGDSPLSPVALPPEFGYSFLGFFFLTNIQVSRKTSWYIVCVLICFRQKGLTHLHQIPILTARRLGEFYGNYGSIGLQVEKISCPMARI